MTNFMELMDKGGPVMWVIFVVAWLAIIMLVERAIRLHRWRQQIHDDHQSLKTSDDWQRLHNNSPLGWLVQQLNEDAITNEHELSKQINTHLAELMPRMEGTLPTIAILGSLLPMLGLLGTVTGMINVFEAIALHGTGNPQEMAHGISQALLTTASGLLIAIPVIFAHHLLSRRLRLMLSLIEQGVFLIHKQGVKNRAS